MNRPIIAPATDEEVRSGELGKRLRQFNYSYVGVYPEVKPIRLNAKDAQDSLVGGLRAVVAMHWLRIEVLWVDEAARGQGLGSRLLQQAESLAKVMGAHNAAVETFEWQAPGFYARQGYQEAARIDAYARHFYLVLMKKKL